MESLDVKLLRRSLGQTRIHQSIRPLYRDKSWATDLDIVNELGGHTGCVNALSWATGGNLLASGSDDTYLNIWEYNPSSIASPFTLNTSVATGHHANIFSVKFMPHSGDRTVVTCAGDSEVRVFDLEHSGSNGNGGDITTSTRSRKFGNFFRNARWMNEGNTNARVYRSHSDRAKRIVTESSPYLFLSCSEDGEVRQWDLRQPSSAYPPPAGHRRLGRYRSMQNSNEISGDVPPPLISYKRYDLDLNSITCSPSQPHYIALGGAHLHCFLHDRRMLGRDISSERGQPVGRTPVPSSQADESMREATKCVRRFAPNNKRRMQRYTSGHITACKISDARPNELISSWSGDHIYSFDIVKSPDARDTEDSKEEEYSKSRLRNQNERKRKQQLKTEALSHGRGENSRGSNTLRRVVSETQEVGHTTLRVRYGNGESQTFDDTQEPEALASLASRTLLTEAQRQADRIARSLVRLRKTLFDFSAAMRDEDSAHMENSPELTPYTRIFSDTLGQACVLLSDMEDIMNGWSYPVNPSPEQITLENTLRSNRQAVWRFVQAVGVLSKTLGGTIKTSSGIAGPQMEPFRMIQPAPREKYADSSSFYYDFTKAILLWLDGGVEAVTNGFKKPENRREVPEARFPLDIRDDAAIVPEKIRSMLYSLADEEKPVIDLDKNRFLITSERSVFQDQQQAVNAFIRALASIELKMHQGLSEPGIYSSGTTKRVMDKGAAARFWGLKVCRSLLMDASEGINFAFVQQAFGGSRLHIIEDSESSPEPERDLGATLEGFASAIPVMDNDTTGSNSPTVTAERIFDIDGDGEMNVSATAVTEHATIGDNVDPEDTEILGQSLRLDESGDYEEEDENPDDNSEEETESESDGRDEHDFLQPHGPFGLPARRGPVNLDVPFSSHTKRYKGHCNTRTVKDVNYYGLDDEYVVSGSDDGHFFIWDRKTCAVVNILEGDGEVVNVVQGHPYEPMIACSGIDSTVKIFGAGGNSRERYRAAKGLDIANPGGSHHSSLRFGGRSRRANAEDSDEEQERSEARDQDFNRDEQDPDAIDQEPTSKNGLKSRKAIGRIYEITSQNDAERQRGIDDTYMTQGMLARIAAALQRGEIQAVGGDRLETAGGTLVLDPENCSVM